MSFLSSILKTSELKNKTVVSLNKSTAKGWNNWYPKMEKHNLLESS